MQGNSRVLTILNTLLAGELTAIDQYFIHAEMYRDFGLNKLFEVANHEMSEETEHARAIIKRILFLEGRPDLAAREKLTIGTDVPSMLANDLQVEYAVGRNLRAAIAECEQLQDFVTREMLEQQLDDTEEDHTYYLEKQIGLIKLMGLENYIQSQMGGIGAA